MTQKIKLLLSFKLSSSNRDDIKEAQLTIEFLCRSVNQPSCCIEYSIPKLAAKISYERWNPAGLFAVDIPSKRNICIFTTVSAVLTAAVKRVQARGRF